MASVHFFLVDTPKSTLPMVEVAGTTYVLGVAGKDFGIRFTPYAGGYSGRLSIEITAEGRNSAYSFDAAAGPTSLKALYNGETQQYEQLTFTSTELLDKPKGAVLQQWSANTGVMRIDLRYASHVISRTPHVRPKNVLSKVASGAVVKGTKGVKGHSATAPSLSICGGKIVDGPPDCCGVTVGDLIVSRSYKMETARSLYLRGVLNVKQHKQAAKHDQILEVLLQDD